KGDLVRGAAEYEWRCRFEGPQRLPELKEPAWDGHPIPGKTLLLRGEQGLGDAIQFIRYAPLVRERCGRLVVQCHAGLSRLLATARGVDRVTTTAGVPADIAAHAPLLSLMHLLGTTLETIPARVPYLFDDPGRMAGLQPMGGAGLKIGLISARA